MLTTARRVLVAAVGAAVVVASCGSLDDRKVASGTAPIVKPNIVVIMADDMTVADLASVPKTRALVGDPGTSFDTNYASFPLCCPSRATFMSGQYSHNHGVRSNLWPTGGYGKFDQSNALNLWLQGAGYRTSIIGKYLNEYGLISTNPTLPPTLEVPAGWDDWEVADGSTTYFQYNYNFNVNGALVHYGSRPQDNETDVVAQRGVAAIRTSVASGKPFFVELTPTTPHVETTTNPTRSTVRHKGDSDGVPAPRTASFNETDVSDKPLFVSNRPLLKPKVQALIDMEHQARTDALHGLDDLVETVIGELTAQGILDNTVVIFTSDNGYFQGQHRIPNGKTHVYEPSTRVPLLVRGPGFVPGLHVGGLVANVDLAPTITELAGATATLVPDGISLLGVVDDPSILANREILLESGSNGSGYDPYVAIRTGQWKYVLYQSGQEELYDLAADRDELSSLHADPTYAATKADLAARLAVLSTCAGVTCHQGLPTPPTTTSSSSTSSSTTDPLATTTTDLSGSTTTDPLATTTTDLSGSTSSSSSSSSSTTDLSGSGAPPPRAVASSDEPVEDLSGAEAVAVEPVAERAPGVDRVVLGPTAEPRLGLAAQSFDFSSDPVGDVPNKWASVQAPTIKLSDTKGSDLSVIDLADGRYAPSGHALAVYPDGDGSALRMDFPRFTTSLAVTYGGDDVCCSKATDTGTLTLFNGAAVVATVTQQLNLNRLADQTISYSGGEVFNAATFRINSTWRTAPGQFEVVTRIAVGATCTKTGTAGPDVLVGSSGNDIICGLGGDDQILGNGGDDQIIGGDGNDVIDGGSGNDMIWGGAGNDTIDGGIGTDGCDGGTGTNVVTNCEGPAIGVPVGSGVPRSSVALAVGPRNRWVTTVL